MLQNLMTQLTDGCQGTKDFLEGRSFKTVLKHGMFLLVLICSIVSEVNRIEEIV